MTANDLADTAGIASNTSDGYSPGSTWTGYSATSIADSKFEDSNSNANDVVDNAACFDYKYLNARRLPPWPDDDEQAGAWFPPPKADAWFLSPWPDDDKLCAKAEQLDER
jgi:hypothetical protein